MRDFEPLKIGPMEKVDLKNLDREGLLCLVASFGKERYRTNQILRWLYRKGVQSIDEMTNLSRQFRSELSSRSYVSVLRVSDEQRATDGTRKLLFELEDGCHIESVLIPDRKRLTLCVSTQVGCNLGCRFCITGKMGLRRNLTTSEILNQILAARETLEQGAITNIVFMGMGEPLANYENTLKAIRLITDQEGLNFSCRRVTLSTAGLLPELERLSNEEIPFRLAISLNAADEETRSFLMPVNRRYPMKEIIALCRRFPLKRRARITFEYVLVDGINDSARDAKQLVKLLQGIPCKVNLIPLNEAPGIPFRRPPEETVRRFQEILTQGNLTAIVRASRGADISAACGQLGATP